MSAYVFRYVVGIALLLIHFGALAITATADRYNTTEDAVSACLILAPITLVYAIAFLKFVAANAQEAKNRNEFYDLLAAITMMLVIIIFGASLLYMVIKFAYFSKCPSGKVTSHLNRLSGRA